MRLPGLWPASLPIGLQHKGDAVNRGRKDREAAQVSKGVGLHDRDEFLRKDLSRQLIRVDSQFLSSNTRFLPCATQAYWRIAGGKIAAGETR